MTYEDISTTRTDVNGYKVKVEHNGKVSTHYILGASKQDAVRRLCSTGWYINSSRNIVD
jgi:hypothetical protein